MHPANKRLLYIVTSCLIGLAHSQNDPWNMEIHNSIMEIRNSITEVHNSVMEIHNEFNYGYP